VKQIHYIMYCFDMQAILDRHFEGNFDMSPGSHTVLIPKSPIKLSPSRQSSHESIDAVDTTHDDQETEIDGSK
jgi:hypothetical protein